MLTRIPGRRLAQWLVFTLFFAGLGCNSCSASSKPLLWRIEGQKASYLFGTIHIPDERVLKLADPVSEALDGADAVFTEVPMDMGTQMKLAMQSMLPQGQNLEDVLPAELYKRLSALFEKKGIPMMAMGRFKIWAVAVQVALVDHLMELAAKQPLDQHIFLNAQKAGKKVGGLEKPEEQIDVFDSLSREEQIQTLRDSLDDYEEQKDKGVDAIGKLIEIYLEGDDDKLREKLLEEYDPDNPLEKKLMQRLFTDRNEILAERMAKKMKESPQTSFFFAVGAGHMPGPGGIVDRLRKAGFKVTRVKE